MRKFRKFLLYTLLVVVAAACTLSAAAGDTLTFDDLVASLEDNNTTLLQSIEDYRTSSLDVKDAKANYHPQITYTIAGSYVYNHQVMELDTSSLGNKLSDVPYSVYIQNPIFPDSSALVSSDKSATSCIIVLLRATTASYISVCI